jgi:hypothetical protein
MVSIAFNTLNELAFAGKRKELSEHRNKKSIMLGIALRICCEFGG